MSDKIKISQVAKSIPIDNAGINFTSTDVQNALQELRDHEVLGSETNVTSTNGTLTLTSANKTKQFLTGSATGYSVKMPDATTLFLSACYEVINTTSKIINIKDGSGALLFVLSQNSNGFLELQLNGTAAGTWIWWQASVGTSNLIVSYNVVSNTNFSTSANADTLITGMTITPQAGTYAIWFGSQNTGTGAGQQLDCTLYKGASPITDSVRSNLSTSGTHIFQNSTQTIAQFDGSTACAVYVDANGNSMTVGARSLLMIRIGT